jgi:hypothetical protein
VPGTAVCPRSPTCWWVERTQARLNGLGITRRRRTSVGIVAACAIALCAINARLHAHNGPPFPVVTNRTVGNYLVSLWADPDASDDRDPDGRFWVLINAAAKDAVLPPDTSVKISVWPVDHPELIRTETATADAHDGSRRTAAFVLDHEGRFGVKATIAGAAGSAELEAVVEAQYDQRPRPFLIAVFALPFVLIGFVWLKLLLRRRQARVA